MLVFHHGVQNNVSLVNSLSSDYFCYWHLQPATFLTLRCPFPPVASIVTCHYLLMTMQNLKLRHCKGRKKERGRS